ncbi:uncharacterized protein LOC120781131 isoform X2 [Bactrocera tryoni]|uniref:uncharacterized protein LOC120781131 isoform X2 n=1 Tax=Bactrocera tryoni TaxID=59916 RepID=UPI001A964643|nr:uncharacterized protein LOC120781131 isoform X2 [Bactrocera tryoni]
MPRANSCCNPLNKKSHKCVYKNVAIVTVNWSLKFANFVGKFVCKPCQREIYGIPEEECPWKIENNQKIESMMGDEASSDSDSDIVDNFYRDPNYVSCENRKDKIEKVNELLIELGEPPLKKQRASFSNSGENGDDNSESWINDLKLALLNKKSRSDKISLLTTVPLDWTIRRMRRELNISRRMASRAKKLHANCGYGARPKPKTGRRIENSILKKIEEFYLSDEYSRVMPGRKDYISVVKNGQRCQEQKRLLLHNLRDLHTKFKDAFSDVKVSLSTFTRLRPRQCILAGQSGTHNVCVCKIHENMRLKFAALKQELKQKGIIFELNYRDTFKDMMCDAANPDCHLANSAYFEEMKRNVNEGEFIVTLDFSENYTCQVQDAVQSQHWANVQATLHPYVVYYKKITRSKMKTTS